MNTHSSAAHLDLVSAVFNLVLQNEQANALQDAVTFSKLLCVNQHLQIRLLAAAGGHVTLHVPYRLLSDSSKHRSLVLWLLRHLRLGTLRRVDLLKEGLTVPLQDYDAQAFDACSLLPSVHPHIDRLASALGSAATHPGSILPKVERWYCCELPATSLSMLPEGHLTQLVLTSTVPDTVTLQELAALTSLQDLRLPLAIPADTPLDSALSALTSLTALLLVNPVPEVQASIPPSIQELVVVQGLREYGFGVCPLRLAHLTNLRQLTLESMSDIQQEVRQMIGEAGFRIDGPLDMGESAVLDSTTLPTSLQRLTAAGIQDADPLLELKQLTHVTITQWSLSCMAEVTRLTVLTQLTRVELQQQDWENGVFAFASWSRGTQKLPLYVPRLHVEVPATVTFNVQAAECDRALEALTRLSSLTQLQLCGMAAERSAAILTAAAAAGGNGVGQGAWQGTVQQLAATLASLTNLRKLILDRVPAAVRAGRAVLTDWAPVVESVAALPKLHSLQLQNMPVGFSLTALSAARHLTSLQLSNCQLDSLTVVDLISNMQCSSCLQHLTLAVPFTAHQPTAAVLTVISQHLHQLTSLAMPADSTLSDHAVQKLTVLRHLREANIGHEVWRL